MDVAVVNDLDPEVGARAALIDAVAALATALDDSLELEDLLVTPRKRIADLHTALAVYADLDDRLVQADLDGLKAGAAPDSLPAELAQQRTERGHLVDRIDLAAKTLLRLEEQNALALLRNGAAKAVAHQAAGNLIRAVLQRRCALIKGLEQTICGYRSELLTLAASWISTGDAQRPMGPIALTQEMLKALNETPPVPQATEDLRRQFAALHAKLLEDPMLEFDGLNPP
jgi:hypothetical protein